MIPHTLQIGRVSLKLPKNCTGLLLSDPSDRISVSKFVERSPDVTVYHCTPYVDFARSANGAGDVLMIAREGMPTVGIPLYPSGRGLTTGYSGALFPDTERESILKSACTVLTEFLALNREVSIKCIQSIQSDAYRKRSRISTLDCYLSGSAMLRDDIFSRSLRLSPTSTSALTGISEIGEMFNDNENAAWIENDLLATYSKDIRNNIRQAPRHRLMLRYYVLNSNRATTNRAYEALQPVHIASWDRTGLKPHPLSYWLELSKAVQASGGTDLVVLCYKDDRIVAGVTCHIWRRSAIYWSGCSLPDGLKCHANPFCLHAAISISRALGAEVFELGRFSARERDLKELQIIRYKANFQGDLVRVLNFRTAPRGIARVVQQMRVVANRVIRATGRQ